MRDTDRIEPALDLLRTAWLCNPDLRLRQLIVNAADSAVADGIEPCPELFYLEDAVLLEGLSPRVNLS